MSRRTPKCWKCGYELVGLQVTDICPECGTDVWSAPPGSESSQAAQTSLVWGIVSLVCFFMCLGPLAGFVAIPAITHGNKAQREVQSRYRNQQSASASKAGLILGWITVCLSIAVVAFYLLFFLVGGAILGGFAGL